MKTILLKFSGPMQAWGTGSLFEDRYTDYYPSKSAVLGLIAASLGYERNDDEQIRGLNNFDFGLRVDQSGTILKDFHTAWLAKRKGLKERTYVTNRYYLQDSVFVVAIGSSDEAWMECIQRAIKKPYYQPYLGRRALAINADFNLGIRDVSVLESLKNEPWHAAKWYKNKQLKAGQNYVNLEIYADTTLLEQEKAKPAIMKRDAVISFDPKHRKHSFRSVSSFIYKKNIESTSELEHDAFSAIGG